jgi:hypothetical protein
MSLEKINFGNRFSTNQTDALQALAKDVNPIIDIVNTYNFKYATFKIPISTIGEDGIELLAGIPGVLYQPIEVLVSKSSHSVDVNEGFTISLNYSEIASETTIKPSLLNSTFTGSYAAFTNTQIAGFDYPEVAEDAIGSGLKIYHGEVGIGTTDAILTIILKYREII